MGDEGREEGNKVMAVGRLWETGNEKNGGHSGESQKGDKRSDGGDENHSAETQVMTNDAWERASQPRRSWLRECDVSGGNAVVVLMKGWYWC